MKEITLKCDIGNRHHEGKVETREIYVVFDHDQEDGLSKMKPYLSKVKIEMCEDCYFNEMIAGRNYVSAEGAMGYNKYFFKIK